MYLRIFELVGYEVYAAARATDVQQNYENYVEELYFYDGEIWMLIQGGRKVPG